MQPVLEFLKEFKRGGVEFHQFAEENNIDMDSWFEFGWLINETFSESYSIDDVLPLVNFNYVKVETVAKQIVEDSDGIEYGDIVEQTAAEVPNATQEDVAQWLEVYEYDENENRKITGMKNEA